MERINDRPPSEGYPDRVGVRAAYGLPAALAFMLCTLCASISHAFAVNWQVFNDVEDGYSVLLPLQPTLQRATQASPGGFIEYRINKVMLPEAALMISVLDLPNPSKPVDADKVMQSGIESSLKGSNSRLIQQTRIVVDGNQGIEYESEGAKLRFLARTFVLGTKSYTALVVSSTSSPYAEGRRFLDSFHLPPAANH